MERPSHFSVSVRLPGSVIVAESSLHVQCLPSASSICKCTCASRMPEGKFLRTTVSELSKEAASNRRALFLAPLTVTSPRRHDGRTRSSLL